MNISTCVGVYNNLDYTQHFYKTFREVYPTEELVFVSYGSENETGVWLNLIEVIDPNVIVYWENKRKTFSDTYNKCVELATKSYVCFMHNDMVVGEDVLENIEKHLHPQNVVSYSQIEPPIFTQHIRPGKLIQDFGSDLENFKYEEFTGYQQDKVQGFKGQTEPGITFFMALSRKVFLNMGGFDNIFNPFFLEDDDFIKRIKLQGLNCFTSLDSIAFHFVSKTSRFSEEYKETTKKIEQNSQRNFLRKWGSQNSNNKFNVGFIIKNCTNDLLYHLEPWADRVYVDADTQLYIENEQSKTSFDLQERVHTFDDDKNNDILVSFDGSKLDNNQFEIIRNLQNILGNTSPGETYEIGIFNIYVHTLNNEIESLIFIHK